MRCFVSIDLDPQVLEQAEALQGRLKELISGQGVRFTAPSRMHLTLRFLGDVGQERVAAIIERLSAALSTSRCIRIEARDLGAFPTPDRPKVLWMGVSGDGLAELTDQIAEATSDVESADSSPFHGHVTLARISPPSKRVGFRSRALMEETAGHVLGSWDVTAVKLMRTMPDGSYHPLAEIPLLV